MIVRRAVTYSVSIQSYRCDIELASKLNTLYNYCQYGIWCSNCSADVVSTNGVIQIVDG